MYKSCDSTYAVEHFETSGTMNLISKLASTGHKTLHLNGAFRRTESKFKFYLIFKILFYLFIQVSF